MLKISLLQIPITLFCIHGNHEERPGNINTYKTKMFCGEKVYYEEEYPNIFAIDGEIYIFIDLNTLVIGGAYSVDKNYRLIMGYRCFSSEQPSEAAKEKVMRVLSDINNKVDIILSHTCPYKYLPYEAFMPMVDQSAVDNSTEYFLDEVEEQCNYSLWYCGHYHIDKIKLDL